MLVRNGIGRGRIRTSLGTRQIVALVLALAAVTMITACGSSSSGSSGATSLLRQTFTGAHTVSSGVLGFSLSVNPSGSRTITTPITLGLGGPFQSRGSGKLPSSQLNLTINALGHHGQLGIISTGTSGYLTLGKDAYQLPASDFQKLASSFSSAAGGGGSGGLSKLGIQPLHWLTQPTILGNETVGGASTTHIRAHVNVAGLLSDLNTFLQKAAATGATGSQLSTAISSATRQKIAAAVKNATVDVWTGASDKTLRKLSVNLDVPVSGQISTLLGGLSGAAINLTLQYANINQPQTIAAPANVRPFSGFATRIKGIESELQNTLGTGGLGGAASGAGSSTGSASGAGSASGSGSSSSGGAPTVNRYSKCLQQSGGDVSKMQRCAALLNGGG